MKTRTRATILLVAAALLWSPTLASSPSAESAEPLLSRLIDLPLPGQPSRFDYQSLDSKAKRLYFSHMGDGELVVLNTETREIVAHLSGFPRYPNPEGPVPGSRRRVSRRPGLRA